MIGNTLPNMIYVFIPCRLDLELRNTVEDLYEKAAKPDEVYVTIFNQDLYNNKWEQRNFDYISKNILLINVDEDRFAGVGRVRSLAKAFTPSKAKYVMFIDSHSRFDHEWDTSLINKHIECNRKAVFSCYPNGFTSPNVKAPYIHCSANIFEQDPSKSRMFTYQPMKDKEGFHKSTIAGGYLFSTVDWVEEVGFSHRFDFGWNELQATYSSIEKGYEVLTYFHPPIYHLYSHENRKANVHGRPDVFTPQEEEFINILTVEGVTKMSTYYGFNFRNWLEKRFRRKVIVDSNFKFNLV